MVSAVIFDCDGVLVDSEILAHEVEIEVLQSIGLHYDRHDFTQRFMGMSDAAFFAALDEDGKARLGRSIVEEIRGPMNDRLQKAVAERLVEVPGAARAVKVVSRAKAVASSSTLGRLRIKLSKTGLWQSFDPHVYSAEHVTHAKPAPDLFLHAASELGVAPAECLVIEDSVNGVLAGRAAGMRVWGFGGGGHMTERITARLVEVGAERIVATWAEAEPLLASL
jgi:beta-phosphoglucomutase-like phosphatase (HAD superfamily)